MRRLAAVLGLLALAGCAGRSSDAPSVETGTIVGEMGDPRNRARVHTDLAAAYYERGSMAIALEELRVATASDANYAPAHSLLGLVYMDLKENQLAEQSFERALRLSPNDPDINHNFGWFMCNTNREKESVKFFVQAIRNPLYATPWRSYSAAGVCSLRGGNLKDAEEFFQRALKMEPDDGPSLIKLGEIRYKQNQIEEARRLVTRYNKLITPSAESLWLALRIERRSGERVAEQAYANQLRRRFPTSAEYRSLQRGQYD
jgi:type IV pilus assembly protein PilF